MTNIYIYVSHIYIYIYIYIHTECPISPRPQENTVILKNMEKCKEGKDVANRVFPNSSIRILCLGPAVNDATLLTRP
jgi:hypothetical protein